MDKDFFETGQIVITEGEDGPRRCKVIEVFTNSRGKQVLLLEELEPLNSLYKRFSTGAANVRPDDSEELNAQA